MASNNKLRAMGGKRTTEEFKHAGDGRSLEILFIGRETLSDILFKALGRSAIESEMRTTTQNAACLPGLTSGKDFENEKPRLIPVLASDTGREAQGI